MPHNIDEALLESVPGRLVKAAFMVALCMPIGSYLLHPCRWGFRWIFYRSCHNALSIIFPTWAYHIQGTMHRPLYMIEHLHNSDKRGPQSVRTVARSGRRRVRVGVQRATALCRSARCPRFIPPSRRLRRQKRLCNSPAQSADIWREDFP